MSESFTPGDIQVRPEAPGDASLEHSLLREGGHAWVETTIDPAAWEYRPRIGAWAVALPVRGFGAAPAGTVPQRLAGGGLEFRHVPLLQLGGDYRPQPGDYQFTSGVLFLAGPADERPTVPLRFSVYAGRGSSTAGGWRVEGERFSNFGLPVWPGERYARPLPPSASERGSMRLRFATVLEPAITDPDAEPVVFRVFAGPDLLFETRVDAAHEESYAWHTVAVPEGTGGLIFEVTGPPAFTCFAAPVLGPSEFGSYGERPFESRPDIVVFLADTLRADGLGVFGSELELTPNLDAWAAETQRFHDARSVSTFTFPSHASMFSGLYPHQAGAIGVKRALPESLPTIAEVLREAGYRTGAITDSAMVSRRFGLDQGFEWFDEELIDIDSTLERARAFLDADDGRPIFLFVHSYRVHAPYKISDETRERFADQLSFGPDYATLEARLRELSTGKDGPALASPEAQTIVGHMRDQYLGGIADLDIAYGEFLGDLRGRGVLPNGYLLFTSDHGESFDDHGEIGHKGKVWEAQLRIPLLVGGPDLEPGDRTTPASLVDLPRTLAALARVLPVERWEGSSLLEEGERPVFAFQAWGEPNEATLALIDGETKVITFEDPAAIEAGRVLGAFDLSEDPAELDDLAGTGAGTGELDRWRPRILELLRSEVGAEDAHLDADKQAELGALGYTDE